MEKVKVTVKGGGSITVSGNSIPSHLLDFIASDLEEREFIIERVKKGRRPKAQKVLDEGAEGNNHD